MTNSDHAPASDTQLLQLCRSGDDRAFGQIVERYQSLVCSVAFSRCGDLALSEDLAQEAFIVAWQKLSELRDAARFKTWICTIVRNLANRALRQQGRQVTTDLGAIPELAADSVSPVQHAVSAEEEASVWQALAEIPEHYREPLILFYREEQSVARVAESLGLSRDAVKQRLSRGRMMVQEHLAATVESVLTRSKPGKAFTGAVLGGVAGWSVKSAAAASAIPGAASAANAAPSTGGAAGGLGSLWLGPILQLPVLAWLYRTSHEEMRTDQERRIERRLLLWLLVGLTVFAVAIVSFAWWQQYVEPALAAWFGHPRHDACLHHSTGGRLPALWKANREPAPRRRSFHATQAAIRDRAPRNQDMEDALGLLCQRAPGDGVAGNLCHASRAIGGYWRPCWLWHCFSVGCPSSSAFVIRVCHSSCTPWALASPCSPQLASWVWRRELWQPAFADYFVWYVGVLQASAITMVILTTIAWKHVHGRHE